MSKAHLSTSQANQYAQNSSIPATNNFTGFHRALHQWMDIHFDLSNGHEGKFVHLLALYWSLNEVYLCVVDR